MSADRDAAPRAEPTVGQAEAPHDGRPSLFETERETEGEASCCGRCGRFGAVLLVRVVSCPALTSEAPYTGAVRSSHAARAPPQLS